MLSVAIAVEPPAEISALRQVAQSCEQAIGGGRCRDAAALTSADVVTWFALVSPQAPSEPALRIEFRDRRRDGTLIETRVLSFSEQDTEASRWESAGAVIAAFVAARDSTAAAAPAHAPAPAPVVARLPPPEGLAYSADLALFTGPAWDRGGYRWGGVGRAHLAVPRAPQVLALVSLRYAERPGDLKLGFWGVGAGVGARLSTRKVPVSAEVTGELAFEQLRVSARDADGTRQEQAQQNRWGGRLSLNVAWRVAGPVGLVGGVEADALRPSVTIQVGDEAAGRAPAATFAFSLGLRLFSGS